MAKENLLIRQLVATQLLQNRKGHLNISNHVLNSDVTRLQLNQNLTEIPDSPEFKLPSKDFKIQNKSQSLTKTPLLYDRMSYSMDLHPLIKESEIESDQNKEQSIVTPKIKGKPQSTVHRGTHYEYSVMNYFHRLNQDETGVRFSLQCCGGKSDGGVDIWGQLQTADNSKQYRVVVQCKNISRKMSVSTVREFENVLTRLHSDQTEIQNFVLSRNRKKSLLSGVGTQQCMNVESDSAWQQESRLVGVLACTQNLSSTAFKQFKNSPMSMIFLHYAKCSLALHSGDALKY